ncbi:MAG: hypothetical protein LBS24_00380 [Clostridiales Family XIII bacterium]|jgi:hypothetical protein|nr:hypothetical protein [Clostridiales Family XIII bacterium]
METAILAVLSMAAGSLITGGLMLAAGLTAARGPRSPSRKAPPESVREAEAAVTAKRIPPEDGKPTMEEQLAAIVGHTYRGGLKT